MKTLALGLVREIQRHKRLGMQRPHSDFL